MSTVNMSKISFFIYILIIKLILFESSYIMAQESVSPENEIAALDIGDCPSKAQYMDFLINKTYACSCGKDISYGEIYGTEVYSFNSDICTAAVHAGIIKKGMPGRVVLETMDSPPVFKGTTRNGIKSFIMPHPYKTPYGPGAYRIRLPQ